MTAPSGFTAPIDDRWFEDYVAGRSYEWGPVRVEQAEIIEFARKFDPQAMHVDPDKAVAGLFGGLIASGWHTAGMMMRLFVDHFLSTVASVASPGVDEVRWNAPVRPGDELKLRVSILDTRLSRSKPDRGIVISRLEALNQRGDIVCAMRATNLILVRPRRS